MSDSEEEWFEKDIESFTLDINKKLVEETVQKLGVSNENEPTSLFDKTCLYNLMKNGRFIIISFI